MQEKQTDKKPAPSSATSRSEAKRDRDPQRIFRKCTADRTPMSSGTAELEGCGFETRRYAERDRATLEKELATHQRDTHSELGRVRIVTERREEPVR